ncbi:hypothetical protein HBB16_05140 [Pseudonocardia sp. MCCB 268]|nr:hypothetical protein [Pseudonocardia cytotoxica]
MLDHLDLSVPADQRGYRRRSGAGKSIPVSPTARLRDPDQGRYCPLDGADVDRACRAPADRDLRSSEQPGPARPDRPRHDIAYSRPAALPLSRRVVAAATLRSKRTGSSGGSSTATIPCSSMPRSPAASCNGSAPPALRSADARVLVLDDATSSLDTATELPGGRRGTGLGATGRTLARRPTGPAAPLPGRPWPPGSTPAHLALAPHRTPVGDPDYRAVFSPPAPWSTTPAIGRRHERRRPAPRPAPSTRSARRPGPATGWSALEVVPAFLSGLLIAAALTAGSCRMPLAGCGWFRRPARRVGTRALRYPPALPVAGCDRRAAA